MLRRVHLAQQLAPGKLELDSAQAHHLRDVLRLKVGDQIEAFNDAGQSADAVIESCDANHVSIRIEQVHATKNGAEIVIASAVPKGDRADWMIEKLSELGVSRFIPLETARSVVHPKGAGKRERWMRIATESAKQSRRAGVMQIEELTSLKKAVAFLSPSPRRGEGRGEGVKLPSHPAIMAQSSSTSLPSPQPSPLRGEGANAFFLSTEPSAIPILSLSSFIPHPSSLSFLIGPEGGWSPEELDLFKTSGLTGLKLTGTILRVETAAITTAAIVSCMLESTDSRRS